MKYKKSMIIIMLAIFLFAIAAVSASDVNDRTIASEDTGEIELSANSIETDDLKTSPEDTLLSQTDNERIISEPDNGTFKALQDKISNANSSDTIKLENNYTCEDHFVDEDGYETDIKITKSLTIDGQGHTIDAQHKNGIFSVKACNVTIKNVNFVNGMGQVGNAIFIGYEMHNCNILNCSFINNTGVSGYIGPTVYVNNADNCSISNCTFIGNTAVYGGAIYFNHCNKFKVYNCSFLNNSATSNGGAIRVTDSLKGIISSSYFVNNSAPTGSAIYVWNGGNINLKINNNIFINHNGDEINFKNPDTTSNIDYNWFGANSQIQPTFNNINASYWLYFRGFANPEPISVFDSSDINFYFTTNTFGTYDNTLLKPIDLKITATKGTIDKNNIKLGEHVKYTANSTGSVKISATIENFVEIYHMYISKANPSLSIEPQTITYSETPAITINYHPNATARVNITIKNEKYEKTFQNIALNTTIMLPEAIPVGKYNITIACPADDNFVDGNANSTLTVTDGTTFWDLNKTINDNNASEITLNKDYTYNETVDSDFTQGIIINRPLTINGNNCTINGSNAARIFKINAANVTLSNITFINALGEGNVYYENFGGAVYWSGENGNILYCTFENNKANYGGAIEWDGANGAVKYCTIQNNNASYGGGAIVWDSSNGIIENCTLKNNRVTDIFSGGGGAIYWYGANGKIANSTIEESKANQGGAINWYASNGAIIKTAFKSNNGQQGGAVYWAGTNGKIIDSIFENNTANQGGAIDLYNFMKANFTVAYNTFENNIANEGGAIYCFSQNVTVMSNIFTENNANTGSVYMSTYWSAPDTKINNNIILNNGDNGGEFSFRSTDGLDVNNNWFGNNASDYNVSRCDLSETWLFLNATANPNTIPVSDSSEIIFKLYAYNVSHNVTEYDNALLKPINLTITSTNGDVDKKVIGLGDSIKYATTNIGTGSVTASIENATYTIELNIIKSDTNLSVESKEVTYSENTIINLNYNSTATGTVNVTLKGKKHDFKFSELELNATISLGSILVDEYDVTVIYSGDDKFDNATATATLTITLPDIPYYVNVTSVTTNKKTVNITAKSNIPNEIIDGKLLFVCLLLVHYR